MPDNEPTVTVVLTRRELTLIRVACLQRLDRLQKVGHVRSYDETRELLNGKLWTASQELRSGANFQLPDALPLDTE